MGCIPRKLSPVASTSQTPELGHNKFMIILSPQIMPLGENNKN
jgi:hypothetical protein